MPGNSSSARADGLGSIRLFLDSLYQIHARNRVVYPISCRLQSSSANSLNRQFLDFDNVAKLGRVV